VSILIITTLLIYSQSFFYDLIYLDDDILVYERLEETNLGNKISTAFTSNYLGGHYYRPITLLSFVVDSAIGHNSLSLYHLSNFIIHLLTSLLLFLILKNLRYSLAISSIASLFFALDPIHINTVGWIAGRGDLLAALFTLLALYFLQNFIEHNNPLQLLIVLVFVFLAFLSKEASLLIPFLFAAFLFVEQKEFDFNRKSMGLFILIIISLGSYYILRGLLLSEVHIDKFSFTTYYSNFLVLPETISKFFIPIGIKALPRIELFTSVSGLVILLILVSLPIKLRNINKSRYYWGMIWFIILMLPGMVISTMGQDGFFYWDCRSYLPLFGLTLMIAEVFRSIEFNRYKKLFHYLAFLYILAIAVSTFFMLKIYKNSPSYWSSVKDDYPESFLPYVGLFNYYNHSENLTQAESQLVNAVTLRPKESSVRQLLINFYLENDEKYKAFNFVKETVLEDSFNSDFYLEKLISLSIETNQIAVIDQLIKKYSNENKIIEKIKKLIMDEKQKSEDANDTKRIQELTGKIEEIK
jgi:hypothetical protein